MLEAVTATTYKAIRTESSKPSGAHIIAPGARHIVAPTTGPSACPPGIES